MDIKDLTRPPLLLLGLAAAAAAGFAAGLYVARNPEAGRRIARAVVGGMQRTGVALAAAGEQLGDLWAEVRDEVRGAVEAQAFAAAAAGVDAGEADDADGPVAAPAGDGAAAGRRRRPAARKPRRRTRSGA